MDGNIEFNTFYFLNFAKLPVPGCRTLAANLLARLWNASPDIQSAVTFGAAKKAARKLSKSLVND